jgi:hypothetical protein
VTSIIVRRITCPPARARLATLGVVLDGRNGDAVGRLLCENHPGSSSFSEFVANELIVGDEEVGPRVTNIALILAGYLLGGDGIERVPALESSHSLLDRSRRGRLDSVSFRFPDKPARDCRAREPSS